MSHNELLALVYVVGSLLVFQACLNVILWRRNRRDIEWMEGDVEIMRENSDKHTGGIERLASRVTFIEDYLANQYLRSKYPDQPDREFHVRREGSRQVLTTTEKVDVQC